jgi:phosphatidylethanolamine-binding protein (PEBP) family uncharacterized protein
MAFALKAKGFANGEFIPKRHTCESEHVSPALEWSDEPEGTRSFAPIVDDPDAPVGIWNHWLLWDLPRAASWPWPPIWAGTSAAEPRAAVPL